MMSGDPIPRISISMPAPKMKIRVAAPPPPRARLVVVAIDGSSSRSDQWPEKKALHDAVLTTIPGHFEVALAVYRNDLDTFTSFMSDRRKLRTIAAHVDANGCSEFLPDVLARVVKITAAVDVIHITDEVRRRVTRWRWNMPKQCVRAVGGYSRCSM